jgi:hypothetical protein
MSTTFVVYIPGELIRDSITEPTFDDAPFMDEVKVAFRSNGDGIEWTNELAHLLPIDTKVKAIDNTPQGIYTIGDIIETIKTQIDV